jgi:hypothetical protein
LAAAPDSASAPIFLKVTRCFLYGESINFDGETMTIHVIHQRLITLFFTLVALTGFSSAAVNADDTVLLANYLPSGCYHSGQYRQEKVIAGLDQALVTQGVFIYSCDEGLIWHTESPVTETTIYKISGNFFVLNETDDLNPLEGRIHQALGTLLNRLVGGDVTYLQRQFTVATEAESLRLVPKQKRLRKFIRAILIYPQDEQVKITIEHAPGEFTRIEISDRKTYPALDVALCKSLLPTKAIACGALFIK